MPFVTPPRRVLPAAVSVLSAAIVGDEPVAATVLGVHGPALYLDVAGRVLPVVTRDAVPLPTAVRLTVRAGAVDWGVTTGDVVPVGDGRVVLPGTDLAVSRTWRPARVRRVPASALPSLSRGGCGTGRPGDHVSTHGAGDGVDGWLADGIRALFPGVGCPGGRPGNHLSTQGEERGCADAVAGLLGRGRGLTPSGDDALAGALLVAHALDLAGPLAAAVRARLGTTTAVSAALLDAAADGFAARDVVTLVDAALAGDDARVATVLPTVLAVGHSSGRDLVTGVGVALECLAVAASCAPAPAQTPAGTDEPADLTPTGRSAA